MNKEITVYYAKGNIETYYGDCYVSDKGILSIFPQGERKGIHIPLINISKYEIGG